MIGEPPAEVAHDIRDAVLIKDGELVANGPRDTVLATLQQQQRVARRDVVLVVHGYQ